MGLEDVFGKQKKVGDEKKLEVFQQDSNVLNDLISYFKHSLAPESIKWGEDFELTYRTFVNAYTRITPETVKEFNKRLPNSSSKIDHYKAYKGVFLSALMQKSYDCGFNDFEFEKISLKYFGLNMEGKENNPIRIKVKKIDGWCALAESKFCHLEAGEIIGDLTLEAARNCVVKISKYRGVYFGKEMEDSTIYCSDEKLLKELEKQSNGMMGKNNNFFYEKWD